jgi:hypothetical protein
MTLAASASAETAIAIIRVSRVAASPVKKESRHESKVCLSKLLQLLFQLCNKKSTIKYHQ